MRYILFFLLTFSCFIIKSQTVVFEENFETPPYAVSSSGNPVWTPNSIYANNGQFSYYNQVGNLDTAYLTTNAFSTMGNTFVLLEFAHICKVYFFDGATIEVSVDNGTTWTRLTGAEYQGSGQYGSIGDKFVAASYPSLWGPGIQTAMPTNNWWVTETFDISALAANQPNVRVRFQLYDGTNPAGNMGNYGWLIDDIKVKVALSELIPPSVLLNAPIVQDTVYGAGPFAVSAEITDASGIHSAYVVYTVNGTLTDSVQMINYSGNTYEAFIPNIPLNSFVEYYVKAIDNAPNNNVGYSLNYWFYNKKPPIIIGTGHVVSQYTLFSPIYRYSHDSENRYSASNKIYTQSELSNAGIHPGTHITSIAYFKQGFGATLPSNPMTLSVYMANTNNLPPLSTNATVGQILASHTQVYNNTNHVIPNNNGWQQIVLNQPFIYTGGSLEIAVFSEISGTSPYSTENFDWVFTNGFSNNVIGTVLPTPLTNNQTFNGTSTLYKQRPNIKFEVESFTIDAGVYEITAPSGPVAPATPEPVSASIRNFGTNDITSLNISYSVNGIFQQTIQWTGFLAEDMISNPIFLGNATFTYGANTLKVWTSDPNNTNDNNPHNDTLTKIVYGCNVFLYGNYSVGGIGSDFATLDDAIDAVVNCGISGPVIFNLEPGIYDGRLALSSIPNVSAANTVTFKGTNGTIFTYTPTSSALRAVIALEGAKHLRFEDINIVVPDTAEWGWGVYIGKNSEDIHIKNCVINIPPQASTNVFVGVVVSGSAIDAGFPLDSLDFIRDILIEGNTVIGGYCGVAFSGGPFSKISDIRVSGNTLIDNSHYGIYTTHAYEPEITNNTISLRTTGSTNAPGVYLINAVGPFNISSNVIVNPARYGIYISSSPAPAANPSLISNNAVGGGFRNTLQTTGAIYITASANINIFYNSINLDGTSGRGLYALQTATGLRVKNNSFSYTGTGNGYAAYYVSVNSILEHDYNAYYTGSSSNFVYYGSAKNDLTALQATNSPPNNDQNSLSGNPGYTSATFLYPLLPLLKGAATPVGSITHDIMGVIRDPLNPDIGAYEDSDISDIALTDGKIVNKLCLSANDSVYLTVKNVIGDTVWFAVNPLTAYWEVNGPHVSNGTLVIDTGYLLPASSFIFGTTGADLSSPGTYTLSANIAPNPVNVLDLNDTLNNAYIILVKGHLFKILPDTVLITTPFDSVQLSAYSNLFQPVFITEICHLKTSLGAPTGGWPAYLIADDYIELTGVPHADIGGLTLEQWSTTSLISSHTFSSGTLLSPQGTAIIAVGQLGASVPSPANHYYHGNGNFTNSFGSSQAIGRIIRDGAGNVVDAVGYGNFVFPAVSGVSASDWSGNTPIATSSGIRLEGPYTKSATNWINSNLSPQNPNDLNSGITPPAPITDFTWHLNGTITSHNNPDTIVGPYINNGIYQYVATYLSPCGLLSDTLNVYVGIPPHDLLIYEITSPLTEICVTGDEYVSILIGNIGSDTLFGGFTASYQVDNGTIITETVNSTIPPGDTISYVFNTPINFNLSGADSTFYLQCHVYVASDPYHHNDTLGTTIHFLYIPSPPTAINGTTLYGTTATIGASSTNNLNWYASPSSTVILDTGSTFTTPVLFSNTAYYVSARDGFGGDWVGPIDYTVGAFWSSAITSYYPIFDVYSPNGIDIHSVDIYFTAAVGSPFTIVIIDSSGQTIQSYSGQVTVSGGAPQTVNVGFFVPHGSNYGMKFSQSQSAYRNNNGINYPYQIPWVISIKGTNFTNQNYYFYFYNWKVGIGSGCESQRTEVWAIVTNNPPVDAGVVSIDGPASPTNLQSQIATVSIKNYGTSPLTSATINWTVNGQLQIPFSWSGSLAPNQTTPLNIGTFIPNFGYNQIVAWTSNPNGITDPMPLNDTAYAVITAYEPLNGVYTIGGLYPNFLTINEAVNAMIDYTINGPVNFIIRPGQYNERVVIPSIVGASATNTIRFVGTPGSAISFAPTSTNNRAVWLLEGTSYIRLDSLNITIPAPAVYGWAIQMRNACYDVQITNCIINANTTASNTGHAGIIASSSLTDATSSGHTVNKLSIVNNTINGGYYGISLNGNTANPIADLLIENNTISNSHYCAINLQTAQNPVLNKNTANLRHNTTAPNDSRALQMADISGAFVISKNKLLNMGQHGIHISGSQSNPQSVISNNMIGGGFRHQNSDLTSGINIGTSSNIGIFYNNILLDAPRGACLYQTASGTQLDIRNNSFAYMGGSNGYALRINTISGVTHNDYNNYYSDGSNFVYYGSARANLAALQAVNNPTGNDVASKAGNPNYYGVSDLHAYGNQLFASGTPIAGITNDIDGDLRDVTSPCIGADEFLFASTDGGIVTIDTIPSYQNSGILVNPTVVIRNYGSLVLTNIPVSYKVNNGVPVNEVWTGSLQPLATDTFTFATPFSLPNGQFSICAYTSVTGDGNHNNDTACLSAFAIPYLGIPFADDFEVTMNFYATGTHNQWQHGVPGASVINTPYSPHNVWATNLLGDYAPAHNYSLYSPVFNFANTSNVTLSFWYWTDTELHTDGVRVQYTNNGGATWHTLGSVGDPLASNWYNSTNVYGGPAFSGHSNGWLQATYDLIQFNNHPAPLQFRFIFYSNNSIQFNGFAIDNFELTRDDIPYDTGIIAITNPSGSIINGTLHNVAVKIKNFGTMPLTTIPVRYRVNNGVAVIEQWTGNLLPGDTADFTFSAQLSQTASFNLCAYTNVLGDIYLNNDTSCVWLNVVQAQYDAGVTEIIAPDTETIIGTSVNVIVRIKNFGTEALTAMNISYDINSGMPQNESWTGYLSPDEEAVFSFATPFLSPPQNYIICARTHLTTEQNPSNDNFCKAVNSSVNVDEIMNKEFSLAQNIPNPATHYTQIGYYLPAQGQIHFTLKNILGQTIVELSENKSQGQHIINLNTANLPAGLYHYSIVFKGKILTKKLIIN
jgi:parallel beta-helix repeat protein